MQLPHVHLHEVTMETLLTLFLKPAGKRPLAVNVILENNTPPFFRIIFSAIHVKAWVLLWSSALEVGTHQ